MLPKDSSKGDWQNSDEKLTEASEKVTKNKRSDQTPLADLLLRPWQVCFFPQEWSM